MEADVARWLVSGDASPWLEMALGLPDPGSLAAAASVREHLPPERAAAVLDQAVLWRRAIGLGRAERRARQAPGLRFLTGTGLEQATRPEVAAWRAGRLAASGAGAVLDLGCGLGVDSLAMLAAGLDVTAVERDPATAVLAEANLGRRVLAVDAETAASLLAVPGVSGFVDPARRTSRGRTWDVAALSPSWEFVLGLLDGTRTVAVKLGPGIPHRLLPDQAEVTWVSHGGDAVEATLWAGPGARPGRRSAVLLPGPYDLVAGGQPPAPGPVGRWLVEPDPAVIRSGAAGTLAERHGLRSLADHVAYLTGDVRPELAPYGVVFEVLDVLPYDLRRLRAWVRDRGIGTLEIKKRGVDVDPAVLRRQLRLHGPESATVVLTHTRQGARVLLVRR